MRLALATVAVLPLAVLAQAQDNVTAPATNATAETNSTITPNATVNGTVNGTVPVNGTHPNGTTNGTHPSSPATSKPSSGSTAVVPVTFGVGVAGLAMLLGVL